MSPMELRPSGAWDRLAWLCVLLVLSLACGGPQGEPVADAAAPKVAVPEAETAGQAGPRLMVHDARVNLMPDLGALYLVVHNPTDRPDRLLRVETDVATTAETHESIDEGGVMRMRARPEGFEVPASGQLVLEPGGKHVMLMEPTVPEGETVRVVLYFEHAGAVEVQAVVSSAADGGHTMDHGGEGHGGDH